MSFCVKICIKREYFYLRFSMVCMCPVTKRIWVGAKNGGLAFYDLKQHSKCQVCPTCNSRDQYQKTYPYIYHVFHSFLCLYTTSQVTYSHPYFWNASLSFSCPILVIEMLHLLRPRYCSCDLFNHWLSVVSLSQCLLTFKHFEIPHKYNLASWD